MNTTVVTMNVYEWLVLVILIAFAALGMIAVGVTILFRMTLRDKDKEE